MLGLHSHARLWTRTRLVNRWMSSAPRSTSQVRSRFLEYFQESPRNHTLVPSSSLVPNDPTLLFTNAGMVQFKDRFLGVDSTLPDLETAVTSQLCVRAGGKHNDLDNVGYTQRHHTFFEMLGNFSFGPNYFKKEAIQAAWTFLVDELHLPREKLSVSVHTSDPDSAKIWADVTGWSEEEQKTKIRVLGDDDNFWSMGSTGPCGPCTEIFWDQGQEVDGERHLELWNLVFMQFDRQQDGSLVPLQTPCVDTGMGLERIAAVLQGKDTTYATDNFMHVLNHVHTLSSARAERELVDFTHDIALSTHADAVAMRVIGDHARAAAFLIGDGVIPRDKGRGYVLRRIIRRAVTFQQHLGIHTPFLVDIFPSVVESLGQAYPHIRTRASTISRVLLAEETAAYDVLRRGMKVLDGLFSTLKPEATLPGDIVFDLSHSLGMPLELTRLVASQRGFNVDAADFNERREEARVLSRATWAGSGDAKTRTFMQAWQQDGLTSHFLENTQQVSAQILATHIESDTMWVVLNNSPFYPVGGGQQGDRGWLHAENGMHALPVTDALRPYTNGIILQVDLSGLTSSSKEFAQGLTEGSHVTAIVDNAFRHGSSVHHSATHLLQAGLAAVLKTDDLAQAGSLVEPDRLRFDFTFPRALTVSEIRQVEDWVNTVALQQETVQIDEMTMQQAIKLNARALFGEQYGDVVRVVNFGNGQSVELCGGTHVTDTSDIFPFVIAQESSVAVGTRRIEAGAGRAAVKRMIGSERGLQDVATIMKEKDPDALTSRVRSVVEDKTQLEKDNFKLQEGLAVHAANWDSISSTKYTVYFIPPGISSIPVLRQAGSTLLKNAQDDTHVIVLFSLSTGQCLVFTKKTHELKANAILTQLVNTWPRDGGKGGGSPLISQGSVPVLQSEADMLDALQKCL